jgi:hypothetical protein
VHVLVHRPRLGAGDHPFERRAHVTRRTPLWVDPYRRRRHVLTLTIANVFTTPQQLQGFAADDVYDLDELDSVETLMGVDGVLSGGFVWKSQPQTIMLQADSDSNDLFDLWYSQQVADLTTYVAQGIAILPAIGKKFIMTNGFLRGYKLAGCEEAHQPRRFRIEWNKVLPAPT